MEQWQLDYEARERRLRLAGHKVPAHSRPQVVRATQIPASSPQERTLRTLLDGLRSGRLAAADLEDTQSVEGMMCKSAGKTPSQIRAMLNPTSTRVAASQPLGRREKRVITEGEKR